MRMIFSWFFTFTWCLGYSQSAYTSGGKLKPEQAIMDIRHYTISLDVDIAAKKISGYTVIDFRLLQPARTLLFDLLDSFNLSKVFVNGKEHPYTYHNKLITISLPGELFAGSHSVRVDYSGQPHVAIRPPWDDGFTWSTDSTGKPWVAVTAQGIGGKLYFPCKDHPSDEPNEGADMIITVPKGLVVAGPGILKKTSTKNSRSTFHWKTNYTINNYSLVFNVADYVVARRNYKTINGNTVPIEFYVLRNDAPKAEGLLDLMEQSLRIREKYFGEYPWIREKIGIAQTPHLGMEHQTMNAYGNKFRYEKLGAHNFDWLLDHEVGHEWWGNKVTAKDWAHFWIHEGIDSYGDQLVYRELMGDSAYKRLFRMASLGVENKVPVVQGEVVDAATAYTHDIYSKGAYFLHILRYVTGDSIFFSTLKELATSREFTLDNMITTDDVEGLFNSRSGKNLRPLFDLFLKSTEKLQVHVSLKDEDQYDIQLLNLQMDLPLQVVTPEGEQQIIVGPKPVRIKSTRVPEIDPDGYYLKKIIIE